MADDDDDLFESDGLEADDLFENDGGGDDDFLSGDSNFSFLDDSPPGGASGDDDLAGRSGEWGDDLMGGDAPDDDPFSTGRYDGGGGGGGGDDWNDDDLLGDSGGFDDAPRPNDDDPFRPASTGMRQPASRGVPAQTTRDQAVEQDKKRGMATLIGVPLLVLAVLGGAGYVLYTSFFAGPDTTKKVAAKKSGPITVNLKQASSDNYADLQATIDDARKGNLAKGQEPRLLLVESLFLARYKSPDIAKHAEKLAAKYANASQGWKALARGAFEAKNGSAAAARSYLEPLVGAKDDTGYYAQLLMGMGDVLSLTKRLHPTDSDAQAAPAATAGAKSGDKGGKGGKDAKKDSKGDKSNDANKDDAKAKDAKKDGKSATSKDAKAAKKDDKSDTSKDANKDAPKVAKSEANGDKSDTSKDANKGDAKDSAQAKSDVANKAAPKKKTPIFDDAAKRQAARAQAALEAAIKLHPKAVAPRYWLGRLDELGGKTDKAITTWKKALDIAPDHVASRVALGEAYFHRGDLNDATKSLENVVKKYKPMASSGEQANAYHLTGMIYAARQRNDEAIDALTKALNMDAGRTDTIQALAEQYMAAEKYQEALNFFTTNKNLGKEDPDVMLGIARAYMGLEKWDDAIKQLKKGEKLFPNDARFPLYLGRLNRERGAYFDAQKALQRAVEIDPLKLSAHAALAQLDWKVNQDDVKAEAHVTEIRKHPDQITAAVATEVAKFYQMSNRHVIAEQWYKSALKKNPNYWEARLSLSKMYLESGEDEKALSLLERAKKEGVQDIRLSAYLADAYRQSKHFAKAVDQINKVIEKYPKNQEYIFIRGRIYFDQGNFDTAREDFNKAYELDPRFHKAYFYVGRTAFEQHDYKKAKKIFRHVLDYKPNEGEFRYWMGRAFEAEDWLTEALDEYRKATTVDANYGTKNPQLFVRRGRLLSRLGYSGQGKQDIAHALELQPGMKEALVAMGEANFRDKEYQDAIDNFSQVIKQNPELPDVQHKLGMALMYMGKPLQGAQHLQDAVRYGYEDPEVFKTLGYLYKRMHKNRLAIKSFKEYLKRIATKKNVPVATKREMIEQIQELGGSF